MSTKLQDSKTAAKTYWAILSRPLCNKKIPLIPLLLVNDKFVSDFCEKANIFNFFFASICTPLKTEAYYHYLHTGPLPKHRFILREKIYH